MRNSALPPIVRDVVLLALGAWLLVYQAWTGKVQVLLVGAALLCLGISTREGLKSLYRLAREQQDEDEEYDDTENSHGRSGTHGGARRQSRSGRR